MGVGGGGGGAIFVTVSVLEMDSSSWLPVYRADEDSGSVTQVIILCP